MPNQYLDLLKAALCASLYDESAWRVVEGPMRHHPNSTLTHTIIAHVQYAVLRFLRAHGLILVRPTSFNEDARQNGNDWPMFGYTMTGRKRLDALEACIENILHDEIPGDFIETGVWRGGSVILMRAVLRTHGITNRTVWCADSFEGMPVPKETDKQISDTADFSDRAYLTVTEEQVQRNFSRFGLLDKQVKFLKGWFCDSLPNAPIEKLALLRLDGDLYESTMDALTHLYDKVSPGGYVIVDDYNSWVGCHQAVDEFRLKRRIIEPIVEIDSHAIFWRRLSKQQCLPQGGCCNSTADRDRATAAIISDSSG
jgi:O-methyltransferase